VFFDGVKESTTNRNPSYRWFPLSFATFIDINVCSLFIVLVLFMLSVGHYRQSVHQLFDYHLVGRHQWKKNAGIL
jgi:hypothetical protein